MIFKRRKLETLLILDPEGREKEVRTGTNGPIGEFEQQGEEIRFMPIHHARSFTEDRKTLATLSRKGNKLLLNAYENTDLSFPTKIETVAAGNTGTVYEFSDETSRARISFGDTSHNIIRLSKDYWQEPKLFLLDEDKIPREKVKAFSESFERKMQGRDLAKYLEKFFKQCKIRSIEDYAFGYLANTLAFIDYENRMLAENCRLPETLLAPLLTEIQNGIENTIFDSEEKPTEKTHAELTNTLVLANGDILPGRDFVIGKPKTYNRKRELLKISSRSPLLTNCVVQAKLAAIKAYRETNHSIARLAEETFREFMRKYSEEQDEEANYHGEDRLRTIGGYMENGGCCRQRAAALTRVLQQGLGAKARYTRGLLNLNQGHAWTAIHEHSLRQASILADPNLKDENCRENGLKRGLFTKVTPEVIYKGKLQGTCYYNHQEEEPFNVVWRPRQE